MFAVFVPETRNDDAGYYCGFWCGHLSIGEKAEALCYTESADALEAGRIISLLLNVEAHVEPL